jgi:hypothetical protein
MGRTGLRLVRNDSGNPLDGSSLQGVTPAHCRIHRRLRGLYTPDSYHGWPKSAPWSPTRYGFFQAILDVRWPGVRTWPGFRSQMFSLRYQD